MSTSWSATSLPDSATAGAGKTMTRFDGQIKRGDSLVVIQGDLRLKVWALEEFTGAAGARAALTVSLEEVLAGSFPTHVDEFILNANGWDIYLADDPSIPEIEIFRAYDRVIGGLNILKSYGEDAHYVVAEHDEIFAGPDSSKVSEAHLKELEALGWTPSDAGNFSTFV